MVVEAPEASVEQSRFFSRVQRLRPRQIPWQQRARHLQQQRPVF
jgi:hypothetical protein